MTTVILFYGYWKKINNDKGTTNSLKMLLVFGHQGIYMLQYIHKTVNLDEFLENI